MHPANYLPPLRGSFALLSISHGLRRGLVSAAPPGLDLDSNTSTPKMF